MKLNKILSILSIPSLAIIPIAATTSCSLFGETSNYKAFSSTGIYTDQFGAKCYQMERPDKVVDTEDCVVKFKVAEYNGKSTHLPLKLENVKVFVSTAYSTAENDGEITDFTFDENEQKLTIPKKFLQEYFKACHKSEVSQAASMIKVLIVNPQINPEITWKDLADIAANKDINPKTLFMPSSWTYLKVNEKQHKVRILDMNTDTTSDGSTAAFTFEFDNVLTNSDGKPYETIWCKDSGVEFCFQIDTTEIYRQLRDYITPLIKDALGDAGSAMKSITKTLMYNEYTAQMHVGDLVYRPYNFGAFILPLCQLKTLKSATYNNRLNKEGPSYHLFDYKFFTKFYKTAAEGTTTYNYWSLSRYPSSNYHLRTSSNNSRAYLASASDSDETVNFWEKDDVKYPIAPCFCF